MRLQREECRIHSKDYEQPFGFKQKSAANQNCIAERSFWIKDQQVMEQKVVKAQKEIRLGSKTSLKWSFAENAGKMQHELRKEKWNFEK